MPAPVPPATENATNTSQPRDAAAADLLEVSRRVADGADGGAQGPQDGFESAAESGEQGGAADGRQLAGAVVEGATRGWRTCEGSQSRVSSCRAMRSIW